MQRRNLKFILKISVIALFVCTIVGYSYVKSRNLVKGPQIIISAPVDGSTSASSTLEITGNAFNITAINMNDRPIFIDEDGAFRETYLLFDGYNSIKLSAKDKFGHETSKIIQVVYHENI